MIERIAFENFRGFENLELSDMKPITLISGKNNAGKSSILEGIFLFLDHAAPESFLKLNNLRGNVTANDSAILWECLFYQMNTKKDLRISVKMDGEDSLLEYVRDDSFVPPKDANMPQDMMNQIISSAIFSYTLKFHYNKNNYSENGHFIAASGNVVRNITTTLDNRIEPMPYVHFIASTSLNGNSSAFIAEKLGKIELEGKKQTIIDALKLIDPMITDITVIFVSGIPQIYIRIGSQLLPLALSGDGLNRLLFIILSIAANPYSIILIDEIETGFHYSMYPKLWKTIAQTAQESQSQLIATTHSYECIVGASEGMEQAGRKSDFCYYRIDKNNKGSCAYRYSDELLRVAVSTDMEVR